MTRIYKIIEVNIVNFLFGICAIFFLMSDKTTHIGFIDNFFYFAEKYRVKYFIALAVCIVYFVIAGNKGFKYFKTEFRNCLISVGILTVISLYALIFNSREMKLFDELFYFLVPIFFSFMYINANDGIVDKAIDIVFYLHVIEFFLMEHDRLTIRNLLRIDIINSYSPFESELAFLLGLLVIFYLWKGNKVKCGISFLLLFLSLKRFTLLFAVLCFFFFRRLSKKAVKNTFHIFFIVLFMLVPVVLELLCSDAVANWFFTTFGLELNQFVKGRFEILNVAFDMYAPGGGLGSTRMLLSNYYREIHGTGLDSFYDLHCDNVRIYLECYSIGFLALLTGYIKSAKSYTALCLIVYIFAECCVNHMFGVGRALYWIVVFLMLFSFNQEIVEHENKENSSKEAV